MGIIDSQFLIRGKFHLLYQPAAAAQAKISEVTSKIEAARAKLEAFQDRGRNADGQPDYLGSHDLEDISPAERRRLAWHLPDDFGSLPFSKREEILVPN